MNSMKAANLRRFLGIVLFAALVGLGVSIEAQYGFDSVMGILGIALIAFGGLALAAWGMVGGRSGGGSTGPQA